MSWNRGRVARPTQYHIYNECSRHAHKPIGPSASVRRQEGDVTRTRHVLVYEVTLRVSLRGRTQHVAQRGGGGLQRRHQSLEVAAARAPAACRLGDATRAHLAIHLETRIQESWTNQTVNRCVSASFCATASRRESVFFSSAEASSWISFSSCVTYCTDLQLFEALRERQLLLHSEPQQLVERLLLLLCWGQRLRQLVHLRDVLLATRCEHRT